MFWLNVYAVGMVLVFVLVAVFLIYSVKKFDITGMPEK